jgi:hypothetical protein
LLTQLDPTSVRIGEARDNAASKRRRTYWIANGQAALSKRCDSALDVRHLQPEVIHTDGTLPIGHLQLEEGVATDLEARGPQLSLRIRVRRHFAKT